jgi:hypothetical protein
MHFRRLEAPSFLEMARAFGVRDVLRGVPDGPVCVVLAVASPAIVSLVRTLAQGTFPNERVIVSVGARDLLRQADDVQGASKQKLQPKARDKPTG